MSPSESDLGVNRPPGASKCSSSSSVDEMRKTRLLSPERCRRDEHRTIAADAPAQKRGKLGAHRRRWSMAALKCSRVGGDHFWNSSPCLSWVPESEPSFFYSWKVRRVCSQMVFSFSCLLASLLLSLRLSLCFQSQPAVLLLLWLGEGHTEGRGWGVLHCYGDFFFLSWITGTWVITVSLFKSFGMSSIFHNIV